MAAAMVHQEVISAIAAARKLSPERISLDSTFEELGVDSLDSLTIMFALEERFDLSIPDEAVREMRTVGDVVDGLQRLRSRQPSAGEGPVRRA
jgi:acyl carrier protein